MAVNADRDRLETQADDGKGGRNQAGNSDHPGDSVYFSRLLPTERSIRATVNIGIAPINAELREEFINTATAAMNEVIDDFRTLKISCPECSQRLDVSTLKPFSHFECPICGTDITVPKWFDNYLLESAEGMGGMATVYKGKDLTLDREVAVKILSPTVAQDAERCELFLNEARTAATINHQAVIPIYTCGVFEDQPYIIMQYMKRGSLEDIISVNNPPSVADCTRWMRDIADALECASRHGIIHHDVKPGNIMLDNDGNAKIGDFGIAQAINDSRASKIFEMTKSWVSPHYVSPEKAISNKEDFRGDIYSLGASFYHLVTGHTPFKHDDIEELIKQRLVRIPTPPHKVRRGIPRRLSRLILDMMCVNPLSRPGYEEVISELNDILAKNWKNGGEPSPEQIRRSNVIKFSIIAGVVVIWMIFVLMLYHYISGDTASELPRIGTSSKVCEAIARPAAFFSLGDSKTATEVAEKAFYKSALSPRDRQQLALLISMGYAFSGEADSSRRRLRLLKTLNDFGISSTSACSAVIMFMDKKSISPADLRAKLESSGPIVVFAGNMAAFLRELLVFIHGETTYNKVLQEFEILKESAESVPANSWAGCWKARIPVYDHILNRRSGEVSGNIEPVFKKLSDNGN